MALLEIVPYSRQYQPVFERLNRAWIEEHFWMEEIDIQVLTNPEEYLLKNGGQVLIALYDNKPAGVVGLKRSGEHEFEITKMAVDPAFRRSGIARRLMKESIALARSLGATEVILYSNTLLSGAIRLYRSMRFIEIPVEGGYSRSDIKMQLKFEPMNKQERQALIESYGQSYENVKAALQPIPRHMWHWKPLPEKWSIHENLVHLADSEANSYIRARRFIAEPGSGVYGYDQDAWAKKLDYHSQSADDALELFGMLRIMTYKLIRDLPDEVWEHTINHSENGVMTFTDWLRIYENHTHIGQMQRVHKAWLNAQQKG